MDLNPIEMLIKGITLKHKNSKILNGLEATENSKRPGKSYLSLNDDRYCTQCRNEKLQRILPYFP